MQRLEVSGAVRLIYGSLGVKGLIKLTKPVLNTPDINVGEHLVGCKIVGTTIHTHTHTHEIHMR